MVQRTPEDSENGKLSAEDDLLTKRESPESHVGEEEGHVNVKFAVMDKPPEDQQPHGLGGCSEQSMAKSEGPTQSEGAGIAACSTAAFSAMEIIELLQTRKQEAVARLEQLRSGVANVEMDLHLVNKQQLEEFQEKMREVKERKARLQNANSVLKLGNRRLL